jgi:hypothetical protein
MEGHSTLAASLHYSLDTLWPSSGACEHSDRANGGEPPSRLFKVEIGNWVKTVVMVQVNIC